MPGKSYSIAQVGLELAKLGFRCCAFSLLICLFYLYGSFAYICLHDVHALCPWMPQKGVNDDCEPVTAVGGGS